jgi:hypothetical protein
MYILSALFKDTRIGEDVLQYAEKALIVAINGFDSVFWNVRNASTLLYSSLINRIFGTNRSKDGISKKNRLVFIFGLIIVDKNRFKLCLFFSSMPGRMFFLKFPQLYQFFADTITNSLASLKYVNFRYYFR